jgi:hypothetical protein
MNTNLTDTPSLRPSFREAISLAEKQIGFRTISMRDKPRAHEICAIIAEVYMMAPDKPIRISGEWLDGYIVQQVFREITMEHAQAVIDEFERITEDIVNKKAYLRTMLYNSIFTLDAHYANRVKHDMGG